MAEVLLNTIALEPNRWTAEKIPHYGLGDLLDPVRTAGFRTLEVWQHHLTRETVDAVRDLWKRADGMGLRFGVVGGYPEFHHEGAADDEAWQTQMDILEKTVVLGAPMLKIFLGRVSGTDADEALVARTARRLRRLEKEAADNGVDLSVELHGGTLFQPVETGEQFLAEHGFDRIGICYQPFDFADSQAAAALADRFAGRIRHVHLQGRKRTDDGFAFCPLAEADIDYAALIPRIAAANPAATWGIEFVQDCTRPAKEFSLPAVLEHARRDADFVHETLGG
ncbi:MAG: sugar phosphate isomerase/epimerase family protein [Planctomycetota bacterium]